MHTYPITIRHIFISPGHNYFGRPKDGPGPHATLDVDQVEAVTGQGLRGDRYLGVAAHYDAQITFVAWEVFSALRDELGIPDASPSLMRRNVVVEGVPLNQLIGQPFQLDFGTHVVDFAGAKHCAPCAWMNAMLAPGAQHFLRGRGGLRARILSDGLIVRGPARLRTEIPLNLDARLEPLARPRLP
ncbi:MAG: molybdenum cofactor biosysynthesis protein [Caldilineaceae bacterium]|nr:molybdenum cofactor biosysynthesis protein [Caldilineaceae bacterium]